MTYSHRILASLTVFVAATILSCVGPQGPVGPKGDSGDSCTILQGAGFALIECPDGSSALVFDGEDSASISWTNPCPGIETSHPELLLVQGGIYYAVYASGSKIHLARLVEGVQYRTTDGRDCRFKLEDLL